MVTGASLTVLELDLGSQASIRQFATDFDSEFIDSMYFSTTLV
ncbi:hypothetical protein C480_20199 [Natrialba aegyptia DSM 13077]|uniref:Uncharacterized protein n=2 Tax=Natrialba aegyptia TaxID=129789 RepID=M0AMR3_9EURY|nr:hypothetical protein C480_20199 [Natrialba aegyptia DSM 13077]